MDSKTVFVLCVVFCLLIVHSPVTEAKKKCKPFCNSNSGLGRNGGNPSQKTQSSSSKKHQSSKNMTRDQIKKLKEFIRKLLGRN